MCAPARLLAIPMSCNWAGIYLQSHWLRKESFEKENILRKIIFWGKNILWKKNLLRKRIFWKKNLWEKESFEKKGLLRKKVFWEKDSFEKKTLLRKRIFWKKESSVQDLSGHAERVQSDEWKHYRGDHAQRWSGKINCHGLSIKNHETMESCLITYVFYAWEFLRMICNNAIFLGDETAPDQVDARGEEGDVETYR